MSTAATLTDWKAGLEDVVATRSAICTVDGAAGRLYYRGYEIADLAGRVSFEEVTHLLWFGELPGAAEGGAFAARLAGARGLPAPVDALLRTLPASAIPSTRSAPRSRWPPPSIPTCARTAPRRTWPRRCG